MTPTGKIQKIVKIEILDLLLNSTRVKLHCFEIPVTETFQPNSYHLLE